VSHQFHDEGLEDPIQEVAELHTKQNLGLAKVSDSTFVPAEDGVSALVSVAGNPFPVSEEVEECNADLELNIKKLDVVREVQLALRVVFNRLVAEFSITEKGFDGLFSGGG
jgi:hypothetical protein